MDKAAQYAEAAALFKQAVAEGADEAQARAAYDAAVARIAAIPDAPEQAVSAPQGGPSLPPGSPQTPQNAPGVGQGILDKAKAAAGLVGGVLKAGLEASPLAMAGRELGPNKTVRGVASTLAQGYTGGYADEVLGAGDPRLREAMRADVADFAKENPTAAFGLNVAGGIASGAGLREFGKRAVPYASKAAALLGKSAMAQGALAGAGMSEGDLGDRAFGALTGGVVGGALGGVAGAVSGKAAQSYSRIREGARQPTMAAQRALSALAGRVEESKIGLDGLSGPKRSLAQGATIADDLGVSGQRLLRGIRTLGGEPGERIDDFMNERLKSYPKRIADAFYNGKSVENIVQVTDDLIEEGRKASGPLYERFRALPPVADEKIEEMLTRGKLFKEAMNDAVESIRLLPPAERAAILGGKVEMPDGEMMKLRTPAFLDEVKKAAGDVIYARKTAAATGGLKPISQGREKDALREFVNRLDEVFVEPDGTKIYKEARNAWAGPADLRDAMADGAAVARGKDTPEQVAKDFAKLTDSEKGMFIRGMLDDFRQQAESGGLKPAKAQQDAVTKKLRVVLGADADIAIQRINDEVRSLQFANVVAKGSQTTDKAGDLLSEIPAGKHLSRMVFLPRRFQADVIDNLIEAAVNPFSKETRKELTTLALSPSGNADVLKRLAGELKSRDAGRAASVRVKPAGAAALETSYGFFRAPRDERGNRR